MAPMKQSRSNHGSSNHGEGIVRQANILASCYVVDSAAASLKGLHYCTTGLAGAECPPLAALTTTNQLALTPRAKKSSSRASSGTGRSGSSTDSSARHRRRGGAALRIREECERFFCETLRATFLGERNSASQRSGLASVYDNCSNNNGTINDRNDGLPAGMASNGQLTPPDDFPIADETVMGSHRDLGAGVHGGLRAWLEIWDYAGGSSFRGFVAEDASRGTKSLFVFFDAHSISRDLKQALVALIELAEGPFACSHMVICIERSMAEEEARPLTKGLQWAGFSITTLDFWSAGFDVLSDRWLFMGMEV